MIRHIVLHRFRADVPDTERAAIYADLAALKSVVPGYLTISSGPNISPEGLHQGYTDAFAIDFVDAAARDAYLVHPAHKAAGSRLVAALEGERNGLIVFDIEV
ncbi:Stress responsive A/B Barrel Domain [Devosia lucknowensis]|uniref:Stress responsive A/B Barrel Domain n=1 Tax=Devosia lucknowensis TaxID=1096929 RepID=A0A1Y6EK44_9HYPH|nr:Dabb family protein [Devosia lucknowensis]SMQ62719.1 Stress responsive A/B Barrel Domain [Devosia lucknowensis]